VKNLFSPGGFSVSAIQVPENPKVSGTWDLFRVNHKKILFPHVYH